MALTFEIITKSIDENTGQEVSNYNYITLPGNLAYKNKTLEFKPLLDSESGNVVDVSNFHNYDMLSSKVDIYEINITTINTFTLINELITNYLEKYNTKKYIINISDGNIKLNDIKITSYSINSDKVNINALSREISSGKIVDEIQIKNEDGSTTTKKLIFIDDICCNKIIPKCINFIHLGNRIAVISDNLKLVSKTTYDNADDNSNMIPITCEVSSNIIDIEKGVMLEFDVTNKFNIIEINIGMTKCFVYCNLFDPISDLITQKLGNSTYSIIFDTHDILKDYTIYTEIYKINNATEELYCSYTGLNNKITFEPGDYKIKINVKIGFLDFIISKEFNFSSEYNKFSIQFLSSTIIEAGKDIKILPLDDVIIEIPGYNSITLSKNTISNIKFDKIGRFNCNIYSTTSNKYIGSFVVQVLGNIEDQTFMDVYFDERPIFGKPIILRIDSVENNSISDITVSGDITLIEKINDSTYKIKFNKPFSNIIEIYDNDGKLLLYKIINIDLGSYSFNITSIDNGFQFTALFDTIIKSEHFIKTVYSGQTVNISEFTTGKFKCRFTMYLGNKTFSKNVIVDIDSENALLYNPFERNVYFLHPNRNNIDDIEWYINDNLYIISTDQINVNNKFGDNIEIKVKYYINKKEYEISKNFNMNANGEFVVQFKSDISMFTKDIVLSNPQFLLVTDDIYEYPKVKFEYIKNKLTIGFKTDDLSKTDFFYLGNSRFIASSIDSLKIIKENIGD